MIAFTENGIYWAQLFWAENENILIFNGNASGLSARLTIINNSHSINDNNNNNNSNRNSWMHAIFGSEQTKSVAWSLRGQRCVCWISSICCDVIVTRGSHSQPGRCAKCGEKVDERISRSVADALQPQVHNKQRNNNTHWNTCAIAFANERMERI